MGVGVCMHKVEVLLHESVIIIHAKCVWSVYVLCECECVCLVHTCINFVYVAACKNSFHCKNDRCIKETLHCDHKDDCGDNSDEESCGGILLCYS